MPEVFREVGYRFFFFSLEGTEAPHIHVESAEKYAKFWLTPIALVDPPNEFRGTNQDPEDH